MNRFQLGVIEGFYGEPWSWSTRREYADFLRRAGYSFYYYAPKADPYLRKKWREPFPEELYGKLETLIRGFHDAGVEFGVGFSPYEIYLSFDSEAKRFLTARIDLFNKLGIDRLAILFDDMKCAPGLAETQADILHFVRDQSHARQLIMCPTYYSLDPVLDKVFGPRPADYLETLGRKLDRTIGTVWTGEEVCSKNYTAAHVQEINERLQRKIWLWDNYPVNDGPKMCKFLHLAAFQDRPAVLSELLQAHAVNPMNQAQLSKIPLLTLQASYRDGKNYRGAEAFLNSAIAIAGERLGKKLEYDLPIFIERGFDQLDESEKGALIKDYSQFNHPVATEVVAWLRGETIVTRDVFLTQ